ncbi:MAG: 4Fe-4S dicluster domain-containing protein [Fulvivirga sp.]|nr:4Fe-4S dicluster domain-containing protein [Fulvivirga sp.]
MGKHKKNSTSRRKFLSAGIALGGATGVSFADQLRFFVDSTIEPSGEIVKLLSQTGEIIEIDKAYLKPVPEMPAPPLSGDKDPRKGIPDRKFVMVIDLSKCKNLKKCQSACNKMHFVTSENSWVKIYSMQDGENTAPYWQPTICMHCDEPPCVKVCPVDATYKRSDGIVLVDNERCIGCRFCMAACPYSTRVFTWEEPDLPPEVEEKEYSPETSVPPKMGTVGKCDFCPDMVKKGELPHCVSACPNGVFYFGDINEDTVTNGSETIKFSTLIRDRAGYRLMEDFGTKPSVYYLPPSNRIFPYEEGLESKEEKDGNAH